MDMKTVATGFLRKHAKAIIASLSVAIFNLLSLHMQAILATIGRATTFLGLSPVSAATVQALITFVATWVIALVDFKPTPPTVPQLSPSTPSPPAPPTPPSPPAPPPPPPPNP